MYFKFKRNIMYAESCEIEADSLEEAIEMLQDNEDDIEWADEDDGEQWVNNYEVYCCENEDDEYEYIGSTEDDGFSDDELESMCSDCDCSDSDDCDDCEDCDDCSDCDDCDDCSDCEDCDDCSDCDDCDDCSDCDDCDDCDDDSCSCSRPR
ncbi:MAG: hypothetical protein K5893_10665 [Prevotella sp.]|nr:hypothetical protein [Prevotella sp.]